MAAGKSIDIAGVRVTNPERVVFPDAGCTKRDVAAYYGAAGQRMMDYAGHRPLSLVRCPQGREGECFFQKHAGKGFPIEIDTVPVKESSGATAQYILIAKPAGFVAAAQMGTIEFHLWGAQADRLERPDRLVFDLDPDEGLAFDEVKQAALEMRDLLAEIGLESAPMLTGGKGVHVIVPLRRTIDWDTLSLFARTIAAHMAERHADRYVATMSKARRKGKVFIDWLRNERGATAVAPYSIRARKGAPVAMPVTWAELNARGSANGFDMKAAHARLQKPCPLAQLGAQNLSQKVLAALESRISSA